MATGEQNHYDVIVIGAGINGAGIFREAATRGAALIVSETAQPAGFPVRWLQVGDVPVPAAGGHLHLSGYVLLDAGSRAAGLAAMDAATTAGCTVSLDPASTRPLAGYGVDRWLADTAAATLLLPNAEEARLRASLESLSAEKGDSDQRLEELFRREWPRAYRAAYLVVHDVRDRDRVPAAQDHRARGENFSGVQIGSGSLPPFSYPT